MEYEWDDLKRRSNIKKHGIDFIDAVLILEDDYALTIEKNDELHNEIRFITVGMDPEDRILTMVYTYRGNKVRVISARVASRSERKQYEVSNGRQL